jgi:heat shock protein HslJ
VLETGPSATFSGGTVSGSTGCNRYTASYTHDGSALERVEDWRLEDGELVLGELRFHEASPAGAWDATSFVQRDAVSSPVAGTEVTAVFGEDGTLAGTAGCNTYRATYEIDGAAITIGEPVATEKACTMPEGVMEQEQAYLAALPRAASYRVEGPKLSLLTAEGTYVATHQRTP